MSRVTRIEVFNWFENLRKAIGKPAWHENAQIGAWKLSYAACYGGYIIEELANEAGGIFHPLLSRRLKAAEMLAALQMAYSTINYIKEKNESIF